MAARHRVAFQQIQELPGLEAGHGDDRRARAQPGVHDPGQPGLVEERQRGDHHVAGRQGEQGLALDHVGDKVAVAEHHSLAQPGRATRIRDRGDVAGRVERHLRCRAGVAEQLGEGGNAGGPAEHEHLAVTGLRGRLPGDIEERRRRQQQLRPRIGELQAELARRVAGVGRRAAAAGRHRAVEGDRVLRNVGPAARPAELTTSSNGARVRLAAAIPDVLNIDVVAVFQIFSHDCGIQSTYSYSS